MYITPIYVQLFTNYKESPSLQQRIKIKEWVEAQGLTCTKKWISFLRNACWKNAELSCRRLV